MASAWFSSSLLVFALIPFCACSATPSPGSDACVPLALPYELHGHCIEPLGDGFLAFGGFHDGFLGGTNGSPRSLVLRANDDGWRPRADLVVARAFTKSCRSDGAVFAIGRDVERYDAVRDRWDVVVAEGVLPDSHFGAAGADGTAFVLGGYPVERSAFHVVDLRRGEVGAAPPPPDFGAGDHFQVMAVLDGALHVVGGLDAMSFTPRSSHWRRERDGTWVARAAPPAPLWAKFAIAGVVEERLYVFDQSGSFVYDPRGDRWSACAAPPKQVAVTAAFARGHELWALGGMDLAKDGARVRLCYDTRADRWTAD